MSSAPAQPNILFLFSDQHHAGFMGCAGHPLVQTPHLDRLAAEGVRCTTAICQNPICTPSRTSFLSGQYCHNHGYYGLCGPKPHNLPSLFSHFQRAGYATAAIGKIHCPAHWVEEHSDFFYETCGCSIDGQPLYDQRVAATPGLAEREDHNVFHDLGKPGAQAKDARPSAVSWEECQEYVIAEEAIGFMQRTRGESRPFFVWASFPKPHQNYAPVQRFWDLYPEEHITLPASCDADLSRKAPHLRAEAEAYRRGGWALFEPKTFPAARLRKLRGYLGCVSQVDAAVGKLLEWLDATGLSDDTLVAYSSDHGDYAAAFDLMEKAPGICSDAVTRIPMIWRAPGKLPAGQVTDALIEAVDVFPTLAALAGQPAPVTADGHDLSALLRGEKEKVRDLAVTENPWSRSVRSGRWRLVYYPPQLFADTHPEGFGELYDLEADPDELHNLYFEPAHATTVRRLERQLLDWLVTTTRVRTAHLPFTAEGPDWSTTYRHTTAPDGKISSAHFPSMRLKNYL